MKKTYYLFNPGELERKDNTLKFTPISEDGSENSVGGPRYLPVEDINDAANTQDLSDDLLHYVQIALYTTFWDKKILQYIFLIIIKITPDLLCPKILYYPGK
jgi:hypothetical protein